MIRGVFLGGIRGLDGVDRESQLDRIEDLQGQMTEHGAPVLDLAGVRAAQQQAGAAARVRHRPLEPSNPSPRCFMLTKPRAPITT